MPPDPKLIQTAKALRLQKGLSQNFLVDGAVTSAIVEAVTCNLPPGAPIIEIGAGAGFLTAPLLVSGHPVTAIEVDKRMAGVLNARFHDEAQFKLIHQDVRQVNLAVLLDQQSGRIVGNLPYHLTGPILFQLTGELYEIDHPLRGQVDRLILMVQKEVGERLLARHKDSAYGQLSIHAQFWWDVSKVIDVGRKAFYPMPKVDSVVVMLTSRITPRVSNVELRGLSRLIKASFMHRRKTLLNNLKIASLGSDEQIKAVLSQLEMPVTARPQEVSIEQYGQIYDALSA